MAAPDLFNCVIDYVMEKVTQRVPGVKLGSFELADLEYADDTAILTGMLKEIEEALRIFKEEAEKLGLSVNWEKTKLMRVGDGPDPDNLTFEGEKVEFVHGGGGGDDGGEGDDDRG